MKPGERVCLAGALALLGLTFLTRWYGVAGLPRRAESAVPESAAGPWPELTLLRWLILATAIAALGRAVAPIVRRAVRRPARPRTVPLTAGLAGVTAIGVFYRVLIDPPNGGSVDDVKLGAYLALLSVVAIGLGATLPEAAADAHGEVGVVR